MNTGDIAVSRLGFGLAQPTAGEAEDAARLQAGIDASMRGVIADRYNPTVREASPKVCVVGAVPVSSGAPLVRGTGWAAERPLAMPPGQAAIERLVNAELPHGGRKEGA